MPVMSEVGNYYGGVHIGHLGDIFPPPPCRQMGGLISRQGRSVDVSFTETDPETAKARPLRELVEKHCLSLFKSFRPPWYLDKYAQILNVLEIY